MVRRNNNSDKFEVGMDFTMKRARDRYKYDIHCNKKILSLSMKSYQSKNRRCIIMLSKIYDDVLNKAWCEYINNGHVLKISKNRHMREYNDLHHFVFINRVRSLSDMTSLHMRANNDEYDEENSMTFHLDKLSKMKSRILINIRRHK